MQHSSLRVPIASLVKHPKVILGFAQIIFALNPVVNGFYYFGVGSRLAMIAESSWSIRLLYMAFGTVLLFLPLLANLLLVEVLYMNPELGDMAMWVVCFLTGAVIGVMHSRISISLGAAQD